LVDHGHLQQITTFWELGHQTFSRNGAKELEGLDVKPQIDSFHPDFVWIVWNFKGFF